MARPISVVTVAGDNPLIVGYVEAKDTDVSLSDMERDASRSRPATAVGNIVRNRRDGWGAIY